MNAADYLPVFPDSRWIEVGGHSEPTSDLGPTRHWVKRGPLYRSPSFALTITDLFRVATSGLWHVRRRANAALRRPDALLKTGAADGPLLGLTFHEAQALAELIGGRLPEEKELEFILSESRDDLAQIFSGTVGLWTNSFYDPYSYCLCAFDRERQRWTEPKRRFLKNVSPSEFTIFTRSARGWMRRPLDTNAHATSESVFLGALVVFDRHGIKT